MSLLDKRRQEIKQQDDGEDSNVEQDKGVESTAAQKDQDEGFSIFRYCTCTLYMFSRNHMGFFFPLTDTETKIKLNVFECSLFRDLGSRGQIKIEVNRGKMRETKL